MIRFIEKAFESVIGSVTMNDVNGSQNDDVFRQEPLPDLTEVYAAFSNMNGGPFEVILQFLDIKSLDALSLSCSHFYEIVHTVDFWKEKILHECTSSAQERVNNLQEVSVVQLRKIHYLCRWSIIQAQTMGIVHMGDRYWVWKNNVRGALFSPCAKLRDVCWLDVAANTTLPPGTWTASWRVMSEDGCYLEHLDFAVHFEDEGDAKATKTVQNTEFARNTGKWFTIEVGPFVVAKKTNAKISIKNHSGSWKRGLIIDCLELK
jgi:hypothetical protein